MLNNLQTGDWVFVNGKGFVSKAIRTVTFSKVSHVGIMYDKGLIFETDITWGKAKFNPIEKYRNSNIYVYRIPGLSDFQRARIKGLCEQHNGRPYSTLDILTNFVFAPFHPKIRGKLVSTIGNKYFQICSEQVCDITFHATGYSYLKCAEGVTPDDLLRIAQEYLTKII